MQSGVSPSSSSFRSSVVVDVCSSLLWNGKLSSLEGKVVCCMQSIEKWKIFSSSTTFSHSWFSLPLCCSAKWKISAKSTTLCQHSTSFRIHIVSVFCLNCIIRHHRIWLRKKIMKAQQREVERWERSVSSSENVKKLSLSSSLIICHGCLVGIIQEFISLEHRPQQKNKHTQYLHKSESPTFRTRILAKCLGLII